MGGRAARRRQPHGADAVGPPGHSPRTGRCGREAYLPLAEHEARQLPDAEADVRHHRQALALRVRQVGVDHGVARLEGLAAGPRHVLLLAEPRHQHRVPEEDDRVPCGRGPRGAPQREEEDARAPLLRDALEERRGEGGGRTAPLPMAPPTPAPQVPENSFQRKPSCGKGAEENFASKAEGEGGRGSRGLGGGGAPTVVSRSSTSLALLPQPPTGVSWGLRGSRGILSLITAGALNAPAPNPPDTTGPENVQERWGGGGGGHRPFREGARTRTALEQSPQKRCVRPMGLVPCVCGAWAIPVWGAGPGQPSCERGEGGVWDANICAPKMARQHFPFCKFRFVPRRSLWSGGGGGLLVEGGRPPPFGFSLFY